MKNIKNILFIPCYNCEKQILRTLEKIPKNIGDYFSEILIVNNCSTDNTYYSIKEFFKNYKYSNININLINNKINYGLGGSHKIAFRYAVNNKYDYICVFHGDDQTVIDDVLKIFDTKNIDDYDVFLGSRFMKDSRLHGYSKIRIYGNIIFNLLFSIVLNKKIDDLGSGLNLYGTKILNTDFYKNFPEDLTFNYMMILAHKYYGHKIKFFPILWQEKDQISNVKIFKQTISMFKMLINYIFFKNKFIESNMKNHADKYYNFYVEKHL